MCMLVKSAYQAVFIAIAGMLVPAVSILADKHFFIAFIGMGMLLL